MFSALKSVLGAGDGGNLSEHPERIASFNDFSLNTGRDHERTSEELQRDSLESQTENKEPQDFKSARRAKSDNVWRSVFAPNTNYHMKGSVYDNAGDQAPSVWQNILRAENIKRASFCALDTDSDGFISVENLRSVFGSDVNVSQLIKSADKNGDGKIDFQEFTELLRHS